MTEVKHEHPIIHCLVTGPTGYGKTKFAATYPKPMLVQFWDGFGNDMPYLDQGEAGELDYYEDGTPWRDIQTPGGLIKIEYYHDEDPEDPSAYERYLNSLPYLNPQEWATIICDSVSEAVKTARWYEQFALNPNAKGQAKMQWWGESADKIERVITGNFKSYQCNTAVIAHLADRLPKEDAPFWPLDLPGRLSTGLPRSFGEVYLMRIVIDENGRRRRAVQTESDGTYMAKTHLDLPMFIDPHYDNLWRGEDQKTVAKKVVQDKVRGRKKTE